MKKFWSGSGRSGVFQIIVCIFSRKVFLTKMKNIEKPGNVNSHNFLIFPDRFLNRGHYKAVY